jgi:hypothetical protein
MVADLFRLYAWDCAKEPERLPGGTRYREQKKKKIVDISSVSVSWIFLLQTRRKIILQGTDIPTSSFR